MIKKYTLKTPQEARGKRLDVVLAEWLPQALGRPVSKAKARKLIVAGAVYLNGRRVRIASKELLPGATIDAYVDPRKLFDADAPSRDIPFEMTADRILFEDGFLIAVNKPPGLPTQPTLDEARVNLFAALKKFLSERDGVAQPYLALHHRLDRDTSGVILFAKAREANAGVAELFSGHLARKTYHALSAVLPGAILKPEWSVKNYLGRVPNPGGGKQARFGSVRSGGDVAHTEFKLIERFDAGPAGRSPGPGATAWIEARPLTGRTHQIRVHLSEAGLPILGDPLYGPRDATRRAPSLEVARLMLHASSLSFPHPIHRTPMTIECLLPEDFLQCAAMLRSRSPSQ